MFTRNIVVFRLVCNIIFDTYLRLSNKFTRRYSLSNKNIIKLCHVNIILFFIILTEGLGDVEGVDIIKNTVERLCELENNGILKTQNQYMKEIASYTGTYVCTNVV